MCGTPPASWRSINKNVCEHTEEAREHYLVKWTEATFFDSERAYWPSVSCAGTGSGRCFGGVEDQQQKQQRQRSAADAVGATQQHQVQLCWCWCFCVRVKQQQHQQLPTVRYCCTTMTTNAAQSFYGRMRQQEKQHQLIKCCCSCCWKEMLLEPRQKIGLKWGVMPLPLQCKASWSKICLRQNLMRKKHLE